jgi:hypothetical protein
MRRLFPVALALAFLAGGCPLFIGLIGCSSSSPAGSRRWTSGIRDLFDFGNLIFGKFQLFLNLRVLQQEGKTPTTESAAKTATASAPTAALALLGHRRAAEDQAGHQ